MCTQKRPWLGDFFYPSDAINVYENIKQLANAKKRASRIGYMGGFNHGLFKQWNAHLEKGGLIWRSEMQHVKSQRDTAKWWADRLEKEATVERRKAYYEWCKRSTSENGGSVA